MQNFSVILCCAGIGSRLGLATTKALVSIGGKPLIAWQLEQFRNVEDLRIVLGFQAQDVVNEVRKYRDDVIFVYNHNYFETKTGASYYLGARHANEYVIEWDGDLLVHPDDVKRCLSQPGEYLAYSERSSQDAVFVRCDSGGNVLAFSATSGDYEWTGPVSLKKERLNYTSGNVYNQLEPCLPLPGLKIRACDIDTHEDYVRAVDFIKSW